MMIPLLRSVIKTLLSSTDPMRDLEDWCSHLQGRCLDKRCFKSYQMMIQSPRSVIMTLLFSTDLMRDLEDWCSLYLWRTGEFWWPFWVIVSSIGMIWSNFCKNNFIVSVKCPFSLSRLTYRLPLINELWMTFLIKSGVQEGHVLQGSNLEMVDRGVFDGVPDIIESWNLKLCTSWT